MQVCQDIIEYFQMNKTCFLELLEGIKHISMYDPETKRYTSQWKSPTSPKSKKARYLVRQCEEHCLRQVLAIELDNQSASQQGDRVAYDSLNMWEETKIIAGRILAVSLVNNTQNIWQPVAERNIAVL